MKRLLAISILATLFSPALLFSNEAFLTENYYKGADFPPDEVLSGVFGPDFLSVAGKYKDADGYIHIFIFLRSKHFTENILGPFSLIKLDTNIWIINYPEGVWNFLKKR